MAGLTCVLSFLKCVQHYYDDHTDLEAAVPDKLHSDVMLDDWEVHTRSGTLE